MNSLLKRMFEDEDCSREEAELKAAILGKPYDECKAEWSTQFKKEFILANVGDINSFNDIPNNDRNVVFKLNMPMSKLSMHFYAILKCDGVITSAVHPKQTRFSNIGNGITASYTSPTCIDIEVTFHQTDTDEAFLNLVAANFCR